VVRLTVVKVDDVWRLLMDGERVGRFGVQRDALSCVQDMAREMRGAGIEVEIMTQVEGGELILAEDPSWQPRRPLTLVTS
jgi:hypothetical protein